MSSEGRAPVIRSSPDAPWELAGHATPEDLRAWYVDRLNGHDPIYGFGRGSEDRGAPHLLPIVFYRRGSAELRSAYRDDVILTLLGRVAARSQAPGPEVVRWTMRLLLDLPISSTRAALLAAVRQGQIAARFDEETEDLALAALGVAGESDLEVWLLLATDRPRPGVVQAATRALGLRRVEGAFAFLNAIVDARPEAVDAARAVGALLPSLHRWWLQESGDHDSRAFFERVDRLPAGLLEGMAPMLTGLRRKAGLEAPAVRAPEVGSDLMEGLLRGGSEMFQLQPSETWCPANGVQHTST